MADTVIEVDDHRVRSVNIADELIEYLVNTSSTNAINKFFIVHYIIGRKSEIRKCIQCADLIRSPNVGTSATHKHKNICDNKMKRPAKQPDRSKIFIS